MKTNPTPRNLHLLPDGGKVPPQWAWHYATLLELRANITTARDEHSTAFRAVFERGGSDLGDVAFEERENTVLLAALSADEADLAEIEAALDRIRNGTYGVCMVTGRAIALARLRAIPWTKLSQEAAACRERGAMAAVS